MTRRRTGFAENRPDTVVVAGDGGAVLMDNPRNSVVKDGFVRVDITVERTFPRLPGETEAEAVRRIRRLVKQSFKCNWPIVSPESILFWPEDRQYQERLMGLPEIRRRVSEERNFSVSNRIPAKVPKRRTRMMKAYRDAVKDLEKEL